MHSDDNLLRSKQSPPNTGGLLKQLFAADEVKLIKAPVIEHIEDAQFILHQAKLEAQQIREQALNDAQSIINNAKQTQQNKIAALSTQFNDALEILSKNQTKDMFDLAMAIAKQLVGHDIQVNPSTSMAMISTVLMQVSNQYKIIILVHPDDEVKLKANPKWQANFTHVNLQSDARLEPGGCIIETQVGRVDARLDTQLARLRELMETP